MERSLDRLACRRALGGRSAGLRIGGVVYLRTRYGYESWVVEDPEGGWPAACPDCGVPLGEFHLPGCGIEACPRCGMPLERCGCAAADS